MNKILKAFLWILASAVAFVLIVAIIVYSYFRLFIVPKLALDGMDKSKVIGFTEIVKDLSDKQTIENIMNLNKESALDMLVILDELDNELNAQATSDSENDAEAENAEKGDTPTEKEQVSENTNSKTNSGKPEKADVKTEKTKDKDDKGAREDTNGQVQSNVPEGSVAWENMVRSVNQLTQNHAIENNVNDQEKSEAPENNINSENNDNSNQQIAKENTTAYQRIMDEASNDEISQGLAIISKVDISKVNQLRSQGKTSEAKAYIKSVLTPGEISAALSLYNKYKHLL